MSGPLDSLLKRCARKVGHAEGVNSRRHYALEALLPDIDDRLVRDFIMGNPRPVLEVEFEQWLWKLGLKSASVRMAEGGQEAEVTFDFDTQPEPPRTHIHSFLKGIAQELKPGFSCGTILYTRRGYRLIANFHFQPPRSGMEQFRKWRERQS
jgi:hypothetical protein